MRRLAFGFALLLPGAAHGQSVPQNAVSVTAQPREAARLCGATAAAIRDRLDARIQARIEAGTYDAPLGNLLRGRVRALVSVSGGGSGAPCRYTVRLVEANGVGAGQPAPAGHYGRLSAPSCDLVASRQAPANETAQHVALDIEDMLARCFSLTVR